EDAQAGGGGFWGVRRAVGAPVGPAAGWGPGGCLSPGREGPRTPGRWRRATARWAWSHSRVNTEKTRPPRMTTSAGSSPRATAIRRASSIRRRYPRRSRNFIVQAPANTLARVEVLTPRSLDQTLRLQAEPPHPVPIPG